MMLYIKNMVCDRCKMVVKSELEKLDIPVQKVTLGEAAIERALSNEELDAVNSSLLAAGFELLDNKTARIIEKIKNIIVDIIHHKKEPISINYSDYISSELNKDYSYLSNLFSEVEGITIEKYIILQKIEKVKELLVYNELSLSEIAYQLNYSSVAHLSSQFKKVTGLTPTYFKNIKSDKRRSLDKI